jgi:hypothetical protein
MLSRGAARVGRESGIPRIESLRARAAESTTAGARAVSVGAGRRAVSGGAGRGGAGCCA